MYHTNILILLLLSYLIQSRKIDLDPEGDYCFDDELSNPQYIEYKIQNSNPSVEILVGTRIKDILKRNRDIYCVTFFNDEIENTGCIIPETDDPQELCVFSLNDKSSTTLDIDFTVYDNDPKLIELYVLWSAFILLVVVNCGYVAYIYYKRKQNGTFSPMSEKNETQGSIIEQNDNV